MPQIYTQAFSALPYAQIGTFFILLLPIAVPTILIILWWILRLRILKLNFVASQKPALLEIKLPKEVLKSPAGMEIFFSYLSQGGAATHGEMYLDGKTRPWFSCELVSVEGEVKFYVWCSQGKFKTIVESQLYAQYPNIEVSEVPIEKDYTSLIPFDMEKYFIWGLQYAPTKPDAYPIKTYIDYKLDKDPKDEFKIDPITAVLEYLGSMKAGEYAWIQILVQKHEKEGWKHGTLERYGRDLKEEIKTEIEAVKAKATFKRPAKDEKEAPGTYLDLSENQAEIISAIERHAGKTPFDCMIRSMYIAKKESFNATNIGGLIGSLRQYGSNHLNGFKPGFIPDVQAWKKDLGRFIPFLKKSNDSEIFYGKSALFHAYKLRSFFQLPYKNLFGKPFILTTEELATLFHFPSGIVSKTPTLKRVESKKSEAPSNLPI